jgi:hypothetical protein
MGADAAFLLATLGRLKLLLWLAAGREPQIRSETWQKLSQDTKFLFDLVDDHILSPREDGEKCQGAKIYRRSERDTSLISSPHAHRLVAISLLSVQLQYI